MLKLCLTVILLGCLTQINGENLPVFIWGQKTPSFLPALSQLSGDEFVTLVKSQTTKETLTIVFVENRLSVEDFSQCKLKTETCFQNLRKIEQKTYLTAVEDPIKALEDSFASQSQKSVSLKNNGDFSAIDATGTEKLLFIYLDDIHSNEDYAKHDELMDKLYSSLAEKRENIIAIYTARHPSFVYSKPLVRKVRDAENAEPKEAEKEPKVAAENAPKKTEKEPKGTEAKQDAATTEQKVLISDSKHFMLALSNLLIDEKEIDISSATVESIANETEKAILNVALVAGEHKIGMYLELSGGTWRAKAFSYNGNQKLRSAVPISAYVGKSFGCGNLVIADVVAKVYITLENVQIQPLFDPQNNEVLEAFSDHVNDCIGFFSPAIWGALFVIILLMSILSCGLTFIMDIKTMDRFDDPKGKTITINAQE